MKTGAEAYSEVQAMAKVDVLEIISDDAQEAAYERTRIRGSRRANDDMVDSQKAHAIVSDLIDCARTILRTGFTIEDHVRLKAILERIV